MVREEVLDIVRCANCDSQEKLVENENHLVCQCCQSTFDIVDGRALLWPVEDKSVQELPLKPKGGGSSARTANWGFVENYAREAGESSRILEIGCGRGHFKQLFVLLKKSIGSSGLRNRLARKVSDLVLKFLLKLLPRLIKDYRFSGLVQDLDLDGTRSKDDIYTQPALYHVAYVKKSD